MTLNKLNEEMKFTTPTFNSPFIDNNMNMSINMNNKLIMSKNLQ